MEAYSNILPRQLWIQRSLHVAAAGLIFAFILAGLSTRHLSSAFHELESSDEVTELTVPVVGLNLPLPEVDALQENAIRLKNNSSTTLPAKSIKSNKPIAWQSIKVQSGDNLAKIFNRIGASKKNLQDILECSPQAKKLKTLKPGQHIKYRLHNEGVEELVFEYAPEQLITIKNTATGYQLQEKIKEVYKKLGYSTGEIRDSLFLSGKKAGLDNKIINQIVDIFSWDIDFALDVRKNDKFKVVYEEKYLEGEKLENGPILAVEFINQGKKHRAIRYTDKHGRSGYFSPEGQGLHKPFLRTPVKFTHISSYFGHRNHPIVHRIRHHKGVDYAAPVGTPVKATGDARIVFIGTKNGYGKVIELQHGPKYTTLYAHLSRFSKNLRNGSTVEQGQIIGYVGATGLATGPHLHYEFRIDGIHRDPLTVALPKINLIDNTYRREFLAHAKKMLQLLDEPHSIKLAKNFIK